MRLILKNMVCPRCIRLVEQILENHQLETSYVRLGEVELKQTPGTKQLQALEEELFAAGFELLDDQKKQLIEKVKNLLITLVQSGSIEEHFTVGKYIGSEIHRDYSSVSKLFSEVEGITIEQFFILQKIEKVKEYLMYNEQSLSQIAFNLGYSSTQHLSGQFKKVTGMTPSTFKESASQHRKSIDQIH